MVREMIKAGSFEDGRLPSEPVLARQLETSRTTIRQSLAMLELDGIILRKRGVGTFVNQRVLNIGSRLEEVWDFVEMIKLSGATPGIRHLSLVLELASNKVAEKLARSRQWSHAVWAGLPLMKPYHVDSLPTVYILDKSGKVAQAANHLDVAKAVQELLATGA